MGNLRKLEKEIRPWRTQTRWNPQYGIASKGSRSKGTAWRNEQANKHPRAAGTSHTWDPLNVWKWGPRRMPGRFGTFKVEIELKSSKLKRWTCWKVEQLKVGKIEKFKRWNNIERETYLISTFQLFQFSIVQLFHVFQLSTFQHARHFNCSTFQRSLLTYK